jgi:hypothetical protein
VRRFVLLILGFLLSACGAARRNDPHQTGPGLVFPAHFAEGENEQEKKRQAARPAASDEEKAPPPPGSQPDPEPLRQQKQYEYELAYERGEVSVKRVRPLNYPQPVVTARRMGRFAIELWIGRELVDRVRFDFPLLAADEPAAEGRREKLHAAPNLGDGASASRVVLVPAAERARRAVLIDRATGAATELPWPPDRAPAASAATAEPARPEAPPARP